MRSVEKYSDESRMGGWIRGRIMEAHGSLGSVRQYWKRDGGQPTHLLLGGEICEGDDFWTMEDDRCVGRLIKEEVGLMLKREMEE